jgi:hypothetical protein
MKVFEIAQEDWDRLAQLCDRARTTPVIYMPMAGQKIEEVKSWADHAYENVYDWWKHMGQKHGFIWDTARPRDESKRLIEAEPCVVESRVRTP